LFEILQRGSDGAGLFERAPYLESAGFCLKGDTVVEERHRDEPQMAESQLAELRNMSVLLEEARLLARHLAYHRRAKIEARLDLVLYELERHIEELRAERR
jgi:hypothetical protein